MSEYEIVKATEKIVIYNPVVAKFIPSLTVLQVWQNELENILRMSSTTHVIDCELGYFDLKTVKNASTLLKAKDVKQAVRREIDWFNQPALKPNLNLIPLSTVSLNCFKSMIFHNDHSKVFTNIRMSADELASICCKRYLTGDQMLWINKKLNTMQNDVHSI